MSMDKFEGLASATARKVDDMGRIAIPLDIRRALHIKPGDDLNISVDEATGNINMEHCTEKKNIRQIRTLLADVVSTVKSDPETMIGLFKTELNDIVKLINELPKRGE